MAGPTLRHSAYSPRVLVWGTAPAFTTANDYNDIVSGPAADPCSSHGSCHNLRTEEQGRADEAVFHYIHMVKCSNELFRLAKNPFIEDDTRAMIKTLLKYYPKCWERLKILKSQGNVAVPAKDDLPKHLAVDRIAAALEHSVQPVNLEPPTPTTRSRTLTARLEAQNCTKNAADADRILRGQTKYVQSLAFSPGGKILVSGSKEENKQFDQVTRSLINKLSGHNDPVKCVAFSRDGAIIVTGSSDKTVKVWTTRPAPRSSWPPSTSSAPAQSPPTPTSPPTLAPRQTVDLPEGVARQRTVTCPHCHRSATVSANRRQVTCRGCRRTIDARL
ncbi:WD domain, G-beta repeat [Carpediemonas membranifera]|uniref:WD domain, G-beta repeat n=1 Tax=Carpediemonas membranifera TaxID=201153 RepID=A0A8J6EAX7_9EUKA|nr:WD domain, G-beta repeat [Carpediemonas membranifera]|eukprot:KAG9395650.1 WD domain, G-beta repeat [Carpediemonas membranifera]